MWLLYTKSRLNDLSQGSRIAFARQFRTMSQSKGIQNDTISFNKNKIQAVLPIEMLQRDKKYIEEYIIKSFTRI